jgi:hypothetical protein
MVTEMKNLFKNKKIITLSALAILCIISIVFIVALVSKNNSLPQPTTSASITASWNGLTPGVSSQEDVTNKLGKPKVVDGNTFSFNSQNPNNDNQVVFEKGTANFFKEYVVPSEKRTSDEITSKYGVAQNILYGPDSVNGFYLFVYPSNGIAYIGSPNTKDVLEIWYFKPTTIDDFINQWGSGYSQQQQSGAGY